jgi:hypothetical protein
VHPPANVDWIDLHIAMMRQRRRDIRSKRIQQHGPAMKPARVGLREVQRSKHEGTLPVNKSKCYFCRSTGVRLSFR